MDAPRDVLHGTADDSIENEDTHDNLIYVNVSHSSARAHLLPAGSSASVLPSYSARSPVMQFSEQQSVAPFQSPHLQHQNEARPFHTASNVVGVAAFARGDGVREAGTCSSPPHTRLNYTPSAMPMTSWGRSTLGGYVTNLMQPTDLHPAQSPPGPAAVASGERPSSALLQHTVDSSHNPLSSNRNNFGNVYNENDVRFNGGPVPAGRKKRVSFGSVTIISITPRTSQEPASYATFASEDAEEERVGNRSNGPRGGTSSSQCLFECQTQQQALYSYSVPSSSVIPAGDRNGVGTTFEHVDANSGGLLIFGTDSNNSKRKQSASATQQNAHYCPHTATFAAVLELTPEAVASDDSLAPIPHSHSPQQIEGPPVSDSASMNLNRLSLPHAHPDDGVHVVGSERSATAKFLNFLIADDNPLSFAGDSAADTSITNTMFPTSMIGSDARLAASSSNDLMMLTASSAHNTRGGTEEGLAADEQQRLHTVHVGGEGKGDSTAMAINKEEETVARGDRGVSFSSEHQEASFAQFEVLGMSDATGDSENAEKNSQRKRKQHGEGASNEGSTLVGKKRGPKPVIPAEHSNAKNPWTLSKRHDTSERDAFVSVTPLTGSSGSAKESQRGAGFSDEAVWLDVDSDTNHEAETASPTGDRVVKIMSPLVESSAVVVHGGETEDRSAFASLDESTNADLRPSLKKETQTPPPQLGSHAGGGERGQARTALHGQGPLLPLLQQASSTSRVCTNSIAHSEIPSGEQGRTCSSHSSEAVRSVGVKTVPLICDLCRSAEAPDARGLLFCPRLSSSSAAPPTSSLFPSVPHSFPKPVNASILRPLDAYCVHVSCALWSPEVYYEERRDEEKDDQHKDPHDSLSHSVAVNDDENETKEAGSWVHIAEAVARGALIKCAICRTYGATIGCVSSSCQRSYHYHCACEAEKTGRVVMDHEGLQLMCHRHANKAKKRHRTGEGEDLQ